MPDELLAVSPLDGRYAAEMEALREYFSEFATIRARVAVELAYLAALSSEARIIRPLTSDEQQILHSLAATFSLADARENKDLERITRHDVKAVEGYLRARLAPTSLADIVEYLHFGLTSEDVNNLAHSSALQDSRRTILLPAIDRIIEQLEALVRTHAATLMLARTHGQPAVPTTFGKEIAVFLARLMKARQKLAAHRFEGKVTGAVGNYNALAAAAPQVDWPAFGENFIRNLGLEPAGITTQILPYDNWIEYFQSLQQINSILVGLVQDLWQYVSLGYLQLEARAAEVGSSTMPHKVNPIDLENAEGNLGVANALFEHYARKLPISRLQRDLSDSTVRRTFGTAIGHSVLAYGSLARGLTLVKVDPDAMKMDLDAHWEVVAEGAQTILRAAGVKDPYELLKQLTRGKGLTRDTYSDWVDGLRVGQALKSKLHALSPSSYVGLAEQIALRTLQEVSRMKSTTQD